MSLKLPGPLVSTEWLAANLENEALRIFDCTVILTMDPNRGYIAKPGRAGYEESHIPGASFIDLTTDFRNQDTKVPYMMPGEAAFNEAAGKVGIGDEHLVVLYSKGTMMWSTRVWWMLRSVGFTRAAVLDGGFQKWVQEGRPVNSGVEAYAPADFNGTLNNSLWADKDEVLSEIGSDSVCTINALSRENYLGTIEKSPYGRKGRITGSLSVPYSTLLTEAGTVADEETLKRAFAHIRPETKERVIFY